jgi:Flp pilus assembly protein TadD
VQGDPDAAVADFDKAIALDSTDARAYCNRGLAKFHKGDMDGARADYNRAIELSPRSGEPYADRGILEKKPGNATEPTALARIIHEGT